MLTPRNKEKRYLARADDPANNRLVYVEGDRKASWILLNLLPDRGLRPWADDPRDPR